MRPIFFCLCAVVLIKSPLALAQLLKFRADDKESKSPPKAVRTNSLDDPLPFGAVASMGTHRLRHDAAIYALAFSPDGKRLASAGADNTLRLWDSVSGRELHRCNGKGQSILAVAFSPDGKLVAGGEYDGNVLLIDTSTGKEIRRLEHGKTSRYSHKVVSRLKFSTDGKTLTCGSYDRSISIWDVATGAVKERLEEEKDDVLWGRRFPSGTFQGASSDGKLVATINADTVTIFDGETKKELRNITDPDRLMPVVSVAPDGKYVAYATLAGMIRLCDPATGKEIRHWFDQDNILYLAFSPDGKTLASGSYAGSIRLWDPATGKERLELPGHAQRVNALVFTPDGKILISGSDDATIRWWELASGKEVLRKRDSGRISKTTLTSDGKTLITYGGDLGDAPVRLWNASDGQEIRKMKGTAYRMLAISPDEKLLAFRDLSGTISFLELSTGKQVRELPGQKSKKDASRNDDVDRLAFSPDGKRFAYSTWGGMDAMYLHVCDSTTLKEVFKVSVDRRFESLAYSSDGKCLLTNDGILRDAATGKDIHRLAPGEANRWLYAIAFSADGRLVAGGVGEVLVIWEASSGRELARLPGHRASRRFGVGVTGIAAIAFSPDGKTIASGSDDTTILIWDVALATGRKGK